MIRSFTIVIATLVVACGGSSPPPQPPAGGPAAGDHAGHDQHAQHGGHGQHAQHGDHAQHGHAEGGPQPLGHRFGKADKWVPIFEGKDRDGWQQPDRVVAALEAKPGMTVADVGAGTGYFETRLAAAVSPGGKVIAVDIEPDMVRHMRERFANEPAIEVRQGKPDHPALGAAAVDRILIVDTWHHIPERVAYSKRLAEALEPGGFVLVVDFTMETSRGPPRGHRIEQSVVVSELEQAGLKARVVDVGLPDQFVVRAER